MNSKEEQSNSEASNLENENSFEKQKDGTDKIVNVECTKKLTLETYTINNGMYDFIYSKCPLIPDYIEKKENNKNNKDYIYFI